MVAFLTDSEHCSVSEIDREKAWHLLAILLSIGRPARPAELSARCTLFHASPDFVEFLCLIPDSPLFLTHDAFVTVSLAAFSIFEEFVSKAIVAFVPRFPLRVPGSKKSWSGVVHTYFRKRKGPRADSVLLPKVRRRLLSPFENDENDLISLSPANRIQSDSPKGHIDYGNNMIRSMNILPGDMAIREYDSGFFDRESAMAPLLLDSDVEFAKYGLKNNEHSGVENEVRRKIIMHRQFLGSLHTPAYRHKFLNIEIDSNIPSSVTVERVTASVPVLQPALLTSTMENLVLRKEAEMDKKEFRNGMDLIMTSCLEVEKWCNASLMESGAHVNHSYEAAASRLVEYAGIKAEASGRDERDLNESGTRKGDIENTVPPDSTAQMGGIHKKDLESMNLVNCDDMIISLQGEQTAAEVEIQAVFPSAEPSTAQKQQARSFTKLKTVHSDASTLGKRVLSGSLDHNKTVNSPKQPQQCKRDLISMKPKLKGNRNHNMHAKENRADPTSTTSKNHSESRELPNFESFIIEEEEGSGGYGTVYRARRKNDGKVFAIKCPHANAHTHHVNNEMKMLERFGGRNFVIKYEGSFKSGTSDCFVLEHVEHDRPEVLKREIDIFHLQWYGYCMFRALASLHKQGIVHRDVKPGNFLFSRKFNKGYLIDFNLAMDLQQKYGHNRKSKTSCCVSFDHVPISSTKSALTTEGRKTASGRIWEAISRETAKDSKSALEPKNMKRRADVSHLKVYPDLGSRTIFRSQGADGSGITSTKDATSTKTPSAERMREPLPCQGRKELISLVQEAMQSPNCDLMSVPSSQRKRVAAAPEKVDRNLFYLSPMPLHSTGVAVAGAGLLKKKGDGKHKREGPCVGTKGFRAPEVLFKSPHQGSKVDVWSAGVTLLYLMIGRTPFVGDPEQNVKEIAKLRGCEDLWEVAKLHNRESSFPVELFDIQSLPSMELQEWCEVNTKRPDFLELIPRSLFDLVDKCLTVNPRRRISAEEALRHEFFTSCHEDLRKQRLLRRGLSLDSGNPHHSHGPV